MVKTLEPLVDELPKIISGQEELMGYRTELRETDNLNTECFSFSGCYSVSGCISCYSVE